MSKSSLRRKGMTLCCVGAFVLSGCSKLDAVMNSDQDTLATSIAAELPEEGTTPAANPTFTTRPPKPTTVTASLVAQPKAEDASLNATWRFKGITPDGKVHVSLTNNNDAPLPPEALPQPTLVIRDGSGNPTRIDLLPNNPQTGVQNGLDLPLGPHATANFTYQFDVNPNLAWDATFSIGEVHWQGNLNAV
ncbi:hypothetical protein ACFPVT_08120 [Corynebacterium choanae]|uniref:hypothetical protein n=1 Tax=Corynebacterium choanae TaxID=1862358 RepID=UPI000F50FF66|nr:hypothetical protein [Corynebacterium choanae]